MIQTDIRYNGGHRVQYIGSVQAPAQTGLDNGYVDFLSGKMLKRQGGD